MSARKNSYNIRSYIICFLLALLVHLFFFHSFRSLIEKPECGIAKGISSLELVIAEEPEKDDLLSLGKIKRSRDTQQKKASQQRISSLNTKSMEKSYSQEKECINSEAERIKANKRNTGSETSNDHSSPKSQSPSVGTLGALEAPASYINNPEPLYPEKERMAGHEGTVLLRVTINEQGAVMDVTIEHTSGYSPLDFQAARTVQSRWTFRPAHKHGKSVSSIVLIPIHFSLKN